MQIRSGFRDYYDVGAAWDREPTPVWQRSEQRSSLRGSLRRPRRWQLVEGEPAHLELMKSLDTALEGLEAVVGGGESRVLIVGFCGEYHLAILIHGVPCWDLTTLEWSARLELGIDPRAERRLELAREQLTGHGSAPFQRLGCPIFSLGLGGWSQQEVVVESNPRLARLDFARRIDPWRAWQALERFLGNELATQPDPPDDLPDTLRRDKHGFDERSFKREPGHKRRGRR